MVHAAADGNARFLADTVRVGMWGTVAACVGVGVHLLAGETTAREQVGLAVAAGTATVPAIAGTVIARNEARLLRHSRALAAWWCVTALIAAGTAVWATGGPGSPWVAFVLLPPLFFAPALSGAGLSVALVTAWVTIITVVWVPADRPSDGATHTAALATVSLLAVHLRLTIQRRGHERAQALMLAERQAQLLGLASVASSSLQTLNAGEVVDNLARAARLIGFDATAVFCPHDDSYRCDAASGMPGDWVGRIQTTDVGIVGEVFADGELRTVENYPGHPRAIAELVNDGFRGVVALPIVASDTVEAVLAVATRSGSLPGRHETEALRILTSSAGLALENARRYQLEQQARLALEELDELQDDFVATLNHELRTPVTVIKAAAELLTRYWDQFGEDRRRAFVARVDDHAGALADLLDHLSRFHELEAGAVEVAPGRVDIDELFQELGGRARRRPDHPLVIDVHASTTVVGDRTLLLEALEELIENAEQHTPAGTTVWLTATQDGGHATIAVSDEGPGIAEEDLRRLRARFRRGGHVLTRSTRGVGLGLAKVERIAHLHNCELEVLSPSGGGLIVRFRLPTPAPPARLPSSQVIRLNPSAAGSARADAQRR